MFYKNPIPSYIYRDNPNIKKIIKKIKKSRKVIILGHLEPDGDCIGAQLALTLGLKKMGKKVTPVNCGPFFHCSVKKYQSQFDETITDDYDLAILVDTSSQDRIGLAEKNLDFTKTIIIDHHPTNNSLGVINWINPDFISSCEMVYLILNKLKLLENHPDICQHLLNGILFDNGYYQHIRINKYFSVLASYHLISFGANPRTSYKEMFINSNINTEHLFAKVISRTKASHSGKVLWTYITEEDKEVFAADFDSMKIFKELMNVEDVKIFVFFKIDSDNKKVNISFRSTDDIDISKVAQVFGGGGHKVAAGASAEGEFEEIKTKVFSEIDVFFR
ncbi:MAG: bifunctional oligoribonuclease/PAP phosphatase NrnA [Spirochaetes bacterium]|nr:bifunctional oligoribonuclease/PAP phosphatase NrnA [Spirochaetota bacterium]